MEREAAGHTEVMTLRERVATLNLNPQTPEPFTPNY
jgi:hypothetical protein